MNILKKLYTLILDGVEYAVKSDKIMFRDDKVYVGGDLIAKGLQGTVKVEFIGGLAKLDCGSAVVNGDITGPVDAGNLTVTGNITADSLDAGSIEVQGDVHARVIDAGSIRGKVVHKEYTK